MGDGTIHRRYFPMVHWRGSAEQRALEEQLAKLPTNHGWVFIVLIVVSVVVLIGALLLL